MPIPESNPACKVAIIGAGYTAREHIRALRDVPGVELAAIHSRTRSRAQALAREFGIAAICGSVAELYERSTADLAVIAVPELATNPVAQASFEFPWTIMIEKPPGHNLEDALDMQRAAERKGRCVLVALNRRFLSASLGAKAALSRNSSRRFIKIQDRQDQAAVLRSGKPAEVVRHWMYANSIHTIDYLRVFGRGKIVSAEPVFAWDSARPGTVVCKISYDSGDAGLYEGIWQGPGPWAVTITTPEQRCEMRPLEQLTLQAAGQAPQRVAPDAADTDFKPGFRRQAEAAVRAARGECRDAVSLADAVETMRLIARIFA